MQLKNGDRTRLACHRRRLAVDFVKPSFSPVGERSLVDEVCGGTPQTTRQRRVLPFPTAWFRLGCKGRSRQRDAEETGGRAGSDGVGEAEISIAIKQVAGDGRPQAGRQGEIRGSQQAVTGSRWPSPSSDNGVRSIKRNRLVRDVLKDDLRNRDG